MFCFLKRKYAFEDKLPVFNDRRVINCLFLNEQDVFFYQNGTINWKKCLGIQIVFIPIHFLNTMVTLNTGVTSDI